MRRAITIVLVYLLSVAAYGQESRLGVPVHGTLTQNELDSLYEISKGGIDGAYLSSSGESSFEVKYTGFSPEAQAAFQYAVDIWDQLLKSEVKIKVFATWAVSSNPNNLGSASPVEIKDFNGAPLPAVWYPMPLAEKLARVELNSSAEADIVANFNSGRNDWYLGIDGNCPADKFDFVTVVLHELGHGLGISGTFFVNSDQNGSYGKSGLPKIYDRYIQNSVGQILIDNFQNNTTALGSQLTGNSLVFKSEIAKQLEGASSFPRIYAPSPYNPGSSIAHLDQTTYNSTPNSLMTPFAARAKVQHNPGKLIMGILYEMGWLHTFLDHQSIGDQEDLSSKIFQLLVTSDTVIAPSSVKMIYSEDNFATEEVKVMTMGTTFYETLIDPSIEKNIKYYFVAKDIFNRDYRLPNNGSEFFNFYYGVDTQPPTISHSINSPIIEFNTAYIVNANVSDNIGIDRVYMEFQLNTGAVTEMDLVLQANGTYRGIIDLASLGIQQGDEIKYTITAIDVSSNANTNTFPASGQAIVKVKEFPPVLKYINNLDTDKLDFFGDFEISRPTGFSNGALHTLHPYENAQGSAFHVLSHTLLHPIIVNENGNLEFDEVVLIEPGAGSDYTNPEFTDYVIVEGSRDNGATWLPLINGYDSRSNTDWLNYYNSNIVNDDSKAVGTLNFYRKRKIEIIPTFSTNEIILIRFSLIANASKVGWGWAIDNLRIQDDIVGLDTELGDSNIVVVWPNPAQNEITVESTYTIRSITLMNLWGSSILENVSPTFDVSGLSSGVYLVKIENDKGVFYKRIIKK